MGAHGVTLCDTTGMAYPAQVSELARGLSRALAGDRADPALPQHARHGPRQRAGRDRRRRRPLRCVARRHRRLPVCARSDRQRLQRRDRARARADGLRHRRRPRVPDRALEAPAGADRPRHRRARSSRRGAGSTCIRCRPTSTRSASALSPVASSAPGRDRQTPQIEIVRPLNRSSDASSRTADASSRDRQTLGIETDPSIRYHRRP